MTVSYQYEVASSTSGGFTRLLFMWRGSLYKLIYRELLLFVVSFGLLSALYRNAFTKDQRTVFEKMVVYCDTFINLIPLSFVLGFYVAYVAGRWWQQYMAIPWPDKIMHSIALYVNGNDEQGRMVRRTLMRYLNLTLILVLRSISSAVKRRFPTLEHVVESGFMTPVELEMYQSVPSVEFNTYWIPCTWFISLLKETRRTGRINDAQGLKIIMEEFNDFRSKCGLLWSYDWVSIPLVYTQVVTIATYSFFLAALVGRQYVGDAKKPLQMEIDIYIPVFTILQFFFFMGLLKVAEQLINPFGDDDEDFELNWLIDRHTKVSYLGVDTLMAKSPPLVKDMYFDQVDLILPYTEASVAYKKKTYRGSVHNMQVPEEKHMMFLPEIIEEDEDRASITRASLQNLHTSSSASGLNTPTTSPAAGIWRLPGQTSKGNLKLPENVAEHEGDNSPGKHLETDISALKNVTNSSSKGAAQTVRGSSSFSPLGITKHHQTSSSGQSAKPIHSSSAALLSWPSSSTLGHSDISLHYQEPSEECSTCMASAANVVTTDKINKYTATESQRLWSQASESSLEHCSTAKKNFHSSIPSNFEGIGDIIFSKKLAPSRLPKIKSCPRLIPVRRQSSSEGSKKKGVRWKPMLDKDGSKTGSNPRRRTVDTVPNISEIYSYSSSCQDSESKMDSSFDLVCKHCKHCTFCQRKLIHSSNELGGFNLLQGSGDNYFRKMTKSTPNLLVTTKCIVSQDDQGFQLLPNEIKEIGQSSIRNSVTKCMGVPSIIKTTHDISECKNIDTTANQNHVFCSGFLRRISDFEGKYRNGKSFLVNRKCYSLPDVTLYSRNSELFSDIRENDKIKSSVETGTTSAPESQSCHFLFSSLLQLHSNEIKCPTVGHNNSESCLHKSVSESDCDIRPAAKDCSVSRRDSAASSFVVSEDSESWRSADWSVLLKDFRSSQSSLPQYTSSFLRREATNISLEEVVIDKSHEEIPGDT
ncbi:uncharacterized protein LOC126299489 isoform X1 [Schistocerca gregaria]|uniref:uncharacterized protein LOC126299489 isoform X1 n=2 Tax=Schistocerca gregaria TaxID=7010 RepID=UPI00211E8EF8|nr:uncharacterized protein LOC126299489 isoform X1 [Schistocerca gregaria]